MEFMLPGIIEADMRLEDTTAIITGGGSGIGREASVRFAGEGATVVVADIDGPAAEEVRDDIRSNGGAAAARSLDVTDSDAFEALVDEIVADHGLDVLVNNAGVSHARTVMENIPADERDRVFEVNINGVWNGCRAALPHLKEQGSGAIVNTASLAGIIGAPGIAGYSLTKGGVVLFTKSIAAEAGPSGVRVNAVCPAVTETPLAKRGKTDEEWGELEEKMAENYPLRRLGRPEDVANGMVFLASDDASWITGHTLVIDGGFSCA